jgi:CheY-like chemotaxis protein
VRSAAVLPPLKVLAADDVPQNLELLQLLMSRRGHTLTAVSDGAAVVEQATSGDYDLVLMDFQMPTLDGLDATRAIRAVEASTGRRRTPVIAMTASVLAEHRRASVEVGMDGFASKPVDWFTLSHEIARVLGLDQQCDKDALELPGPAREVLNRRAGLHRWADKEDVYLEALEHFGRQYGDLATTLKLHAAGGAHQELRMLAHKVRGVAANVGLEQLSDALSRLEQATNAVPTDERAAATALDASTAALGEALAAIRSGSPQQPTAPDEAEAAYDLTRARRAGGVLLQALRRGALDDAALAGLAAALAGHPVAPRVAQIQGAIGDFEFDSALEQLEGVMATLGE